MILTDAETIEGNFQENGNLPFFYFLLIKKFFMPVLCVVEWAEFLPASLWSKTSLHPKKCFFLKADRTLSGSSFQEILKAIFLFTKHYNFILKILLFEVNDFFVRFSQKKFKFFASSRQGRQSFCFPIGQTVTYSR